MRYDDSNTFTAHNIRLADGSLTAPEVNWIIADSPWMQSALRIIGLVYGNDIIGKSIVDLGCLEGGYTAEFAKAGMDALGIEVRSNNFANCLRVKAGLSLPNLMFAQDDVWNLAKYGRFDVTFCCGLLYHLEDPRRFIDLMGEATNKLLIINTHVAVENGQDSAAFSEMTEHEGMQGRWYCEYDPESISREQLESAKWTSWNNSRSFWPTSLALQQAMYDAGFISVFEQADWMAPDFKGTASGDLYKMGRRMFVGVKA